MQKNLKTLSKLVAGFAFVAFLISPLAQPLVQFASAETTEATPALETLETTSNPEIELEAIEEVVTPEDNPGVSTISLPVPAIPFPSFVKVNIRKYLSGNEATALSSDGVDFPMTATYGATNAELTTATYNLTATSYDEENNLRPYQATTINLMAGASYATNEITGGLLVGADCSAEQPFRLRGYTSGDTLAEARAATPSIVAPAFTGMTNNKFVIVWNEKCSIEDGGQIDGVVIGGIATSSVGVLGVTSIETMNGTATADGSFENGWKYMFHITVPMTETHLAMKFANWLSVEGTSTIPVANNMRISSPQASNATTTILIIAADTYATSTLNMMSDLDPVLPGLQVRVLVEAAIPAGTINGAYTTSYGVKTE